MNKWQIITNIAYRIVFWYVMLKVLKMVKEFPLFLGILTVAIVGIALLNSAIEIGVLIISAMTGELGGR